MVEVDFSSQYFEALVKKDRMYGFCIDPVRKSLSKPGSKGYMLKTWRSHPHLRYKLKFGFL